MPLWRARNPLHLIRSYTRSLNSRIALWPALSAVVIIVVGGLALWAHSRTLILDDRKRVFEALADVAKRDLDVRLLQIKDDLHFWGSLWSMIDQDRLPQGLSAPGSEKLLDWGLVFRKDQRSVYELVLFIDRNGKVRYATSPHETQEQLEKFGTAPICQLIQLPEDCLNAVLSKGHGRIESPRRLAAVNALHGRNSDPTTPDELPSYYQLVVALPAHPAHSPHSAQPGQPHLVEASQLVEVHPGKANGAVVAIVSWKVFQDELDRVKATSKVQLQLSTAYAFLADSDANTIIGHEFRDPAKPKENFYNTRIVEDHDLAQLTSRFNLDATGIFEYAFQGNPKFAALRKITPPTEFNPAINWYLGVGVAKPEILAPLASLSYWYVLIGALATIAVFAAASLVGRDLSISVKELTRLARGTTDATTLRQRATSDDEISELQEAIGDLAIRWRQSSSFKPLPNPYVVGNPIHVTDMFFGRQEDIAWIKDHLTQAGNELILLIGQRRIGKTSLLRHVQRLTGELRIAPFFVDTQSLIPGVSDDASLYRALLDEMLSQFAEAVPGLDEPRLSMEDPPQENIQRLVQYINDRRDGIVPVLLIDELENFEHKFRRGRLTPDVLNFLAGLLDSGRTISFIATGSDQLELGRARYWHTLLGKSLRRKLGVLSPRDAMRMIMEPLAGRIAYADQVPQRILRFTGGHPYYTQDVCQRLVNALNARRSCDADDTALQEVFDQVLQNPPPPLDYFWSTFLREQGRVFLSLLAHALPNEAARVTTQHVVDSASAELRSRLVSAKWQLSKTVGSLTTGDWLDDEGGQLRFRIDLLRLWLQHEHPPANVEIELKYPAKLEPAYDA